MICCSNGVRESYVLAKLRNVYLFGPARIGHCSSCQKKRMRQYATYMDQHDGRTVNTSVHLCFNLVTGASIQILIKGDDTHPGAS